MTRRLIWCSALVLMALAAELYVAGLYVIRNPNAPVTRCVVVAYEVGTEYNPAVRVARALGNNACEQADRIRTQMMHWNRSGECETNTCKTRQPDNEACNLMDDPAECAQPDDFHIILNPPNADLRIEETIQIDGENVSKLQPVAPAVPSYEYSNGPQAQASEESEPPATSSQAYPPATTISEEPATADNAPETMPPCPEKGTDEAPATMPYVEDDAKEDEGLSDAWKKLWDEAEEGNGDAQTTTDSVEKQDSIKNADQPHEESETTPDAANTPDANGTNPEPQMPSYHDSYCPSCPSSGHTIVCPYTGRSYPADPGESDPQPAPKKKKKKAAKADTEAPVAPGKMSKLIEAEKGTEEVPVHPEVDTTEMRKSDAGKGAFEPMPED